MSEGLVRVLLVEDDEDDFVITRDLFAEIPGAGFELERAEDFESGLAAMCRGLHDVYLVDYRLGGRTGLDLLRESLRQGCAGPVIMLTGQTDWQLDQEALLAGAADYLEKAKLDTMLLARSIRYSLQQRRHADELERRVRERTAELGRANAALEAEAAERCRKDAALGESERRFRLLVEQVRDYAIFATDADGRPTTWNEGVLRVLGFQEAEFLGKDIETIFTPEDQRSGLPRVELEEAKAAGTAAADRWMRRKDGTRFYAAGATTALRVESGQLLGFMKVMRDQSEQKRLEDELRRIAADLSEADQRKNEFLATLAHELRNPLAPIRSGLGLLKMLADDPAAREEIRGMMERQTQQLVRLVDDLMDVSRITCGKLDLRTCRVMLADVVRSAVEAARPLLDEAGHELIVTLPEQPVPLNADPNRLAQVISNLLNNAAKYTPAGGRVELSAARHGRDVVVSVRDTGLGIPADMQGRIFEMFAQLDHPQEKGYSGLGIGLMLVKRLVEMHGGSVEVRSEGLNLGSEFCIKLPSLVASSPAEPLVPAATPAEPHRLRVLVVDDNQAAADTLGMIVRMLGNEVLTAYDGSRGVEAAAEFQPDVVLMDLGMPRMNGYEAARLIRRQAGGNEVFLVALTGWGHDEDRQRTRDAGFDRHLVKPAEPSTLQQLFAEIKPQRG